MPRFKSSEDSGRGSRKVSLTDVAKRAKVATMTASRALSHPELVSEELRARVEQAVHDLGYVPNRAARALASARSKVIAVLIPSLSNAVFIEVIAGIQDALDSHDYHILIGNTRYSGVREEKLLEIYLQSNPEGILLTGLAQSERVMHMLDWSGIPVVSMMDLSADPNRMSVGLSQEKAGRALTCYLLDKGYRRIGFIGSQLDERTLERAKGYRQALCEAGGHDPRRELMVPDPSTIALGCELIDRLLTIAPDCDAVFCCNDDLAHGAIYQCQRRGIAIPSQLAVCGFNDLPGSACMSPDVTTVATPLYRIGFEAASLLIRAIVGEATIPTHIDLGFALMTRDSA
ncbi:MAG TPA: LacI family DNA-binding transcriptional regulator [Burkholderiaceae bacterium]|jgi:LacI family gluconate utilization system Gnt-I transcriptional repressor